MDNFTWKTKPHPSQDFATVRWHEARLSPTSVLRLVEDLRPEKGEARWALVLDDDTCYDGVQDVGPGPFAAMDPQPKTLEEAKAAAIVAWAAWRLEA